LRHAERGNCGTSGYRNTFGINSTSRSLEVASERCPLFAQRRKTLPVFRGGEGPGMTFDTAGSSKGHSLRVGRTRVTKVRRRNLGVWSPAFWPGRAFSARCETRRFARCCVSAIDFSERGSGDSLSPLVRFFSLFSSPENKCSSSMFPRVRTHTRLKIHLARLMGNPSRIDCFRETARDTKIEAGTFDVSAVSNFRRNAGSRVNS